MGKSLSVAIILGNTLEQLGLSYLLQQYFSPISIQKYSSFDVFENQCGDITSVHLFFTSADVFTSNIDFFLPRRNHTIILTQSTVSTVYNQLSTVEGEELWLENLQRIIEPALLQAHTPRSENNKELSIREIDVLKEIVKGAPNKEVAETLNISLNTVLSHRKNITAKLGIKTLSGLTFYAIMNGIVAGDEIND